MNRSLSLALSYVFHPLMMTTYTFMILFLAVPELVNPFPVMALPFLFFTTFLVPTLSLLMLKKLDSIKSLNMHSKQERIMPFFFITVFYGMNAYMFIIKIHVNEIVGVVLLSICVLLMIASIITIWYKISIHAAGMAGLLGFISSLNYELQNESLQLLLILVLVLSGAVMTARLALNSHEEGEIWSGSLLGFTICFFGVLFFS